MVYPMRGNMVTIEKLQPGHALDDLIEPSRAFFAEYEGHHPEYFKIEGLEDADIVAYFSPTLNSTDGVPFPARPSTGFQPTAPLPAFPLPRNGHPPPG